MRHARALRCVLAVTALALPLSASSQGRPASDVNTTAARARAALSPLAALVGEWEGDATEMKGPGNSTKYRQHEDVVFGAGKTVLIVRGTGRAADGPNKGEIVYEAAAMIWFDADSSKLRLRAHRAEGIAVNADVELRPDTLIWGFPITGGRVRYVVAYSATDWHEVGQFHRDGAPPFTFIDMRLKRTK